MKVFFIILHFGDIQVTKACIQSLYTSETYPFSLVVVNNAEKIFKSKDFTKRKITLINTKKNLGFSGGVNVGIRHALSRKADVVVLLNNDTIIKRPVLKILLSEFTKQSTGIVGPSLSFYKSKRHLFDIGGIVNPLFLRTSHKEVAKIQHTQPEVVTYISGCYMAIKKEVLKKIGLFDESFFLYYEDADFCLRAAKRGYVTKIVPSVVIEHKLSTSAGIMSNLAIYYLLKSGIYFGKKHAKNLFQKVAHKLFILFQSALFLKANTHAGIPIIKALLRG